MNRLNGSAEAQVRKGEMRVMNSSGDVVTEWEVRQEMQVHAAQEQFEKLVRGGYMAFGFREKGQEGEVIEAFDPQLALIVMTTPMAGG